MSEAGIRARVLYDFQAQPGSGELSIATDEMVTVTRQDVGEGWWEGYNARGESGLFPAGYVDIVRIQAVPSQGPPTRPAPQLTGNSAGGYSTQPGGDFDDIAWGDEDWDDDNDSQTSTTPGDPSTGNNYFQQSGTGGPTSANIHSTLSLPTSGNNASGNRQASVRKSINRFSSFVKSGGQDYILGIVSKSVPIEDYVYIERDESGRVYWRHSPEENYSCAVTAPRKETKLKGLKSFIAYQITPTFNNIQVSRRYKHFDWLHNRLEEKYICISIPPLPDKQISGRYQNAFIDHRRIQLQLWVNRICRHPVLSKSFVWNFFITCTADEKKWKSGKRRAEKDEFVNASFFFTVHTPSEVLDPVMVEAETEHFGKFIGKMDEATKNLFNVGLEESKKYPLFYKKAFSRVSAAFGQLAAAFDASGHPDHGLNSAIRQTSATYEAIGKLFEEQPKRDYEPLCDCLHEYKGMLSAWPDILQIHKGAVGKKREHAKLAEEGKIDSTSADSVAQRADIVSYSALAEINHFHNERCTDFKLLMENFLRSQITFYEDIVAKLKDTLVNFEQTY